MSLRSKSISIFNESAKKQSQNTLKKQAQFLQETKLKNLGLKQKIKQIKQQLKRFRAKSSIYKIQNIILNQKTKMLQNTFRANPSIQDFYTFFTGLQPAQLVGIQTQISHKMKQNLDSISFDDIKNIFTTISQKDNVQNKKNWKKEEVTLLVYLVDKACIINQHNFFQFSSHVWDNIANIIPGRNGQNCKTKMLSLVPTNLNQTPWTDIQQDILSQIIEEYGPKWRIVSLRLYERSPIKIYRSSKQCRQRYMCFLKPDLKKGYWTDAEDYELIQLFLKYGRKWSKMAQFIKGRNENAIKNRFCLLFEESSNNQKLYYSEFMRKVMRRKQKLEKLLQVKEKMKNEQQSNSRKAQQQSQNLENIKSETNQTERQYKSEQLAEIQKFFTF